MLRIATGGPRPGTDRALRCAHGPARAHPGNTSDVVTTPAGVGNRAAEELIRLSATLGGHARELQQPRGVPRAEHALRPLRGVFGDQRLPALPYRVGPSRYVYPASPAM